MLRQFCFLPFLVCTALVWGCAGKDEPAGAGDGCTEASDDGSGTSASSTAKGDYTPEKGTTTIKGMVKWSGNPPKRRPIDMGAEKYCVNCNPDGAVSETVILGEGGGMANVFVQIKYGLRGWKFGKPGGEVLLDQNKCRYVPHMIGLRVGQTLRIRNSDPIMHNVHALKVGASKDIFNLPQTQKGQEDTKEIRRPGIYVAKCEVHGWMSSYIGVCKHPFFQVTKEDGAFVLSNVPPGEYTIEAWHEKYGAQTQKVTVGDGETSEITFTYKK